MEDKKFLKRLLNTTKGHSKSYLTKANTALSQDKENYYKGKAKGLQEVSQWIEEYLEEDKNE